MLNALAIRMVRLGAVSSDALDVLRAIPAAVRLYPAGSDIIEPGARLEHTLLLTQGLAARYGQTRGGGSQITQLCVPGEFVDLHGFVLKTVDQAVCAVTDCAAVAFRHDELAAALACNADLAALFWRETALEGAIHRQWLTAMGAMDAAERLAHLLCELSLRLEDGGVGDGWSFRLPLTQMALGQILGISTVHVNRTLMELRRLGLIDWTGDAVLIRDRPSLERLAQFDRGYLRRAEDLPGTEQAAAG